MRGLTQSEVEQIVQCLQSNNDLRGLAMFCVSIDSMLSAYDIIKMKVHDIYSSSWSSLLSDFTIRYVDQYVADSEKLPKDWLWTGIRGGHLTYVSFYRFFKNWVSLAGIESDNLALKSLQRTRAEILFKNTGNTLAIQSLLGHQCISTTKKYLSSSSPEAITLAIGNASLF